MIVLFAVFALQACTKDLSTIKQGNTKWELTRWPGKKMPTTAKATLNVNQGNKIGGKSFCNTYGGSMVVNGNAIQFSKIFGTKMYCEAVGDAENKYYADLEKVTAGKVSSNRLYLFQNETLLMVFVKIP